MRRPALRARRAETPDEPAATAAPPPPASGREAATPPSDLDLARGAGTSPSHAPVAPDRTAASRTPDVGSHPAPDAAAPGAAVPVGAVPAARRKRRPLYPRLLRLRHVSPNVWQRFLLGEGALLLAVVLVLADLATAWTLLVLPLAVAAVVKAHDLLAGRLAAGPVRPAHPDGDVSAHRADGGGHRGTDGRVERPADG